MDEFGAWAVEKSTSVTQQGYGGGMGKSCAQDKVSWERYAALKWS